MGGGQAKQLLHLMGTRMAVGCQRPQILGRYLARPESVGHVGARHLGWTRCGSDGQLAPRRKPSRLSSLLALLGVALPTLQGAPRHLAPARPRRAEEQVPPAPEKSEVVNAWGPARSSQGSPRSPHFSFRCCTTTPACSRGLEQPADKIL